MNFENYFACELCPRKCGVNRSQKVGFCGAGTTLTLARAGLHMWEEPCISGTCGSGTVFFSCCNLKCIYCQNYQISIEGFGKETDTNRLAQIFLELQAKGVHNINLVTPTPWLPHIIAALDLVKDKLTLPVVYNTSGYENVEVLAELSEYVDIFLTDLKYFSKSLSANYSSAENYFDKTIIAIKKMIEITGKPTFDANGIMKKGTIIRHMVLPNQRNDSKNVLKAISENFDKDSYILSLMSQYTPFYKATMDKNLNRRVSSFEYKEVLNYAISLGLENGFMQEKSSAKEEYTPLFDLSGI